MKAKRSRKRKEPIPDPDFATPIALTLLEQARARDVNEGPPEHDRYRWALDRDDVRLPAVRERLGLVVYSMHLEDGAE